MKGLLSKYTVLKVKFITGSSNTLFAGVHVSIFQPGSCTGWVSEGVKNENISSACLVLFFYPYLFIVLQKRLLLFIFLVFVFI